MSIILSHNIENPVLIDKYLMGKEIEVDAICDGHGILIPGIMEHIERAGVHSGDSISVYPSQNITPMQRTMLVEYTRSLAKELNVIGLVNIQYVIYGGEVYVIEVNPRSSRTVPYISKVTGVPMVDLATKVMLGHTLPELGWEYGLHPNGKYIAVKVPVFSFEKLHDVDTQLGPEMKSTGEVLGIAQSFEEALFKGLVAAGYKLKAPDEPRGGVLITVKNSDQQEVIGIAQKFEQLGFELYATPGCASVLNRNMVATNTIRKMDAPSPNVMDLVESGKLDYIISTSAKGRIPARHSVQLRCKAVELGIPCLTALDTANALANCLLLGKNIQYVELIDIVSLK